MEAEKTVQLNDDELEETTGGTAEDMAEDVFYPRFPWEWKEKLPGTYETEMRCLICGARPGRLYCGCGSTRSSWVTIERYFLDGKLKSVDVY